MTHQFFAFTVEHKVVKDVWDNPHTAKRRYRALWSGKTVFFKVVPAGLADDPLGVVTGAPIAPASPESLVASLDSLGDEPRSCGVFR